MRKLILICVLLFVPVLAIAQVATSTIAIDPNTLTGDQLPGVFVLMLNAFKSGDWMLGAGLLLSAAVALFKLLGLNKLIPKKYTMWVAAGIAMAGSVAIGLMAHLTWWTITTTGLGIGLMAIGGWQAIIEPIRDWLRTKFPSLAPSDPEPGGR